MKPTEILMAEHRVIEQVLNCLEKMAAQTEATGQIDSAAAQDAIAFFRTFADQCHHGKEEVHLFPAMEARGFPRAGGPTGVMLHEHEAGRSHVRGLAAAVENNAAGEFVAHARAFIPLLREHIQKEDHCLFAMADRAFSAADQAALRAQFEKTAAEELGAGTQEKYLAVANALAKKYGVATAGDAHGPHCGCGH